MKNIMYIFITLFDFIFAILIISSMVDMNMKSFFTDLFNLLKDNFGSLAELCFLLIFFGLMKPITGSVIAILAIVMVWRDER